jgi:hypothetical protein
MVFTLMYTRRYRDLGKPMGGQTPTRAARFAQRFNTWEDATGDATPAFHYGTHYSSAAIVASYLIRMEPFTQLFLKLQGGCFDHADRLFCSVKEAWISASEKNTSDVKELIPEFFYLPEFLCNSNRFDLGVKQSGAVVGDVELPVGAESFLFVFGVLASSFSNIYSSSKLNVVCSRGPRVTTTSLCGCIGRRLKATMSARVCTSGSTSSSDTSNKYDAKQILKKKRR